MKDDLTCCIADFGLAVKNTQDGKIDFGPNQNQNRLQKAPNPRVGTRRYMAPEVLNQTISMDDFGAFQRADVYAVGLLIWEIANVMTDNPGFILEKRILCQIFFLKNLIQDELKEYEPPFYYMVSADPQFEEMEVLICHQKVRPAQNPTWQRCKIMSKLSKLQTECWNENSEARLPMLRIRKTVAECEEILSLEVENLKKNLEARKKLARFNHEERMKQKEIEEKRRAAQREEEFRMIQQQYFHQASPIPHQYNDPRWPQVK